MPRKPPTRQELRYMSLARQTGNDYVIYNGPCGGRLGHVGAITHAALLAHLDKWRSHNPEHRVVIKSEGVACAVDMLYDRVTEYRPVNALQTVSPVEALSGLYILSCYQRHVDETWYVSHTPGHGGCDWGWTKTLAGATPMSPYWVRRFRADMRRVGRTGVASLV